ncbi:MAG: chromosomal replication initiation protein [Candidatus Adlerbacteria bacterium]|nr:chromosomal replication initiation protein [Candidatus Adlerbacteria bacterium]
MPDDLAVSSSSQILKRVLKQACLSLGKDVYENFLARLEIGESEVPRTVMLTAPTLFLKTWVKDHYLVHLQEYWRIESGVSVRLGVTLRTMVRKAKPEIKAAPPVVMVRRGVQLLRAIEIIDIQRLVCSYYTLSLQEMKSDSRQRFIAEPRKIAVYLCFKLTNYAPKEIAAHFGNRSPDHMRQYAAASQRFVSSKPKTAQEVAAYEAKLRENFAVTERKDEPAEG